MRKIGLTGRWLNWKDAPKRKMPKIGKWIKPEGFWNAKVARTGRCQSGIYVERERV